YALLTRALRAAEEDGHYPASLGVWRCAAPRLRLLVVAVDHTCPVAWAQDHGLLAGTPVEASWCLSYKHDLVRALAEPTPMDLGPLLRHDGPLSAFYAPWDWVNTSAKIMLVGITPGAAQAAKGLREAQRCLREGLANEETLRRANAVGSFSGPMRANLVTHARRHRARRRARHRQHRPPLPYP